MGKSNMIKRADGSYSQRGLWDNIRANKGSGKAPTKEMLKQERKINAKYEEGGTKGKPKFPGKLETNQSDNTRVLNTEGRTVANSKLQDQYNKNEIIQYGVNKGKPYGFENQAIRGGMESIVTPGNVMTVTGVGALAKAGANAVGNKFLPNAYKLNPFANSLNNPNKFYRTLGKEGYNDALKNKMLTARVGGDAAGRPSDVAYFAKGKVGNYPGNNYVAEVSKQLYKKGDINPITNTVIKSRHGGYKNLNEFGNSTNVPLSEAKIYEKDWLKGYKEIPNKFANGGINNPGFKALPENIQKKILAKMAMGGKVGYDEYVPEFVSKEKPLPRFYDGGGVRLAGSSTFNSAMKAPAGTVTKTASGKTPSNFGDNVVTGAGIAGAAVPMLTSFIPDDRITDSEGNEIGSEVSLGKGVLNGAAQGASMGAAAGPWGAAIGAGVGAIYGGVTTNMANNDVRRERDQANRRIDNRNITNSVMTNKGMYSTNINNNDQMIAANGGTVISEDMGNPNAELELNETFRDPMTGEVGMVDGPSHDNGGIEMSLAEGTQIWSDRLKHNGRTFASLTKPIINKIANIEKGLDTNPNSRFKQNSIKLLNAQLDFFFNVQESNKQQDEMKRTLKKQEGGVVDDMGNYHYANGGIYIKPENRGKFTAYKERTGKTTEEALHSPNANVRKMANFAKNAAGWKHAMGGNVLPKFYEAGTFNDPETEPEVPINGIVNPNYPNMSGGKGFRLGNTEAQNALIGKGMGKDYTPQYGFSQDPQDIQQNNYPGSWKQNPYSFNNINKGVAGQNTYNFDKIGTPTYQEPSTNNAQGYRRNNNGELMQASALAGSAFAQLNNINRQAAPGIRPDVRLTGAIPTPRYVDLSAERGAINRAAMNAMGNRDFGNSATAQAFKNKARINQLEQAGKSYQNQEIANADIGNKFAGMRGDAAIKEAMMNNEIANTNLENKYAFNQNRMANQNASYATLGKGFGDIGRNRTNQFNEMERLGSISNRYDKSAYAASIRDNPERLKQGLDAGMYTIDELQKWGIPYNPQAKYGGTFKKGAVKTRSLKY
jgi:hypothetical protein